MRAYSRVVQQKNKSGKPNFTQISNGFPMDFRRISGRYPAGLQISGFVLQTPAEDRNLTSGKFHPRKAVRYYYQSQTILTSLKNVLIEFRSPPFPLSPPLRPPSLYSYPSQVIFRSGECFGRVSVSGLLSVLHMDLLQWMVRIVRISRLTPFHERRPSV